MNNRSFNRRELLKAGAAGALLSGVVSQTTAADAPSEVLPPDSSELFHRGRLQDHNFAESSFTEEDVGTNVSEFDLVNANTSNVENMEGMFWGAGSFNQDIGEWDTSNAENMGEMFDGASSFDQDIGEWCVEQISEKPDGFDEDAGFEGEEAKQPDWGEECGIGPDAAADGPTVYVGTSSTSAPSALHAVDATTGEQEWTFTEPSDYVGSPIIVDGTAYVGSDDSTLYAVDVATGEQVWEFTDPNSPIRSPTVIGGTVYIGSRDTNLYAVDAATGEQEWVFTEPDHWVSTPTVVDGTVYIGSYDGNLYAVDAATGEQRWAKRAHSIFKSGASIQASPTVVNETIYFGVGAGTLYAMDAATSSTVWAFTEPSRRIETSPAVVDGTVYFGSLDNNLYAVDAATGIREWVFTEPGGTVRSPTVVDENVYIGSFDSNLYAVDAATGEQVWEFTEPNSPVRSPTIAGGTVYIAPSNLYAVDAATGEQEWVVTDSDYWNSTPTVVADDENADSVDSRVLLGTDSHHDDWRYAGQSIDIPAYTYYTSRVRSNSELLALSGVGIGGIAGGGYLFRRRRAVQHSKQESAEESRGRPTSADDGPATATEESEDDGASLVDELRSEAETALEAATTAREDSQFDEAVDAYTKAISHYQSALEGLNADDNETRTEIEESLDSTRDNLEAVRTRQEQRDDLLEALKAGERSFQEGIVAYTEGGHTLAKIRFRQARGEFEQAVDLVENTDNDDLLNPPIEVSVQPDSELASTTLGELPPIPEVAVTKLADAGVETISDLESSDESPWPPAVVEPLVAEEIITDDAVAMLTLLSWWEDTDSYEFDTAAAISRRRDQAGHGFNQSL